MSPLLTARHLLKLLIAIALIAPGVLIAPRASALPPIVEPAPPADSFYDFPANLAELAPGTIVRTRPVQVKSLQLLPVNADAWQLAYRTQDLGEVPDMAVTTVLVPRGKKPTTLLSYQAATDSTLRICQPSYNLTQGAPIDFTSPAGPLTFSLPGAELLFATAGLNQGWAVAMPDHGGSHNRFLTPRQPGWAVLDGIRAVQNFTRLGMNHSTPTALMGYSGGAIASTWALEEQPTYAPELNLRATAIGAPERDLTASLKAVNGSLLAGLTPLALAAIGKDDEEFRVALDKVTTPEGRARLNETRQHCLGQNVLSNLWFDYNRYLTRPVDQVLAIPAIKKAVKERGITGRAPTSPIYVFNGVTEEVAPITGTDRLVQSYCRGGTPVTYRRELLPPNPVPQIMTTHGTVVATGVGAAIGWLTEQMSSTGSAPTGCDIQTVPTTALEQKALAAYGPTLSGIILTVFGAPVGS